MHDCTPARGLAKRLNHLPAALEGHLQNVNGRAAGLLFPPPSGQAWSPKTRYKSNGDVVFETGTGQSPKNRSSATFAAGPRHLYPALVGAVAKTSFDPLSWGTRAEGPSPAFCRALAARGDGLEWYHFKGQTRLVGRSASLTTNTVENGVPIERRIKRLPWSRTEEERKGDRSFGCARLPLRFHCVFVANAPKTPFHRRGKPKENP